MPKQLEKASIQKANSTEIRGSALALELKRTKRPRIVNSPKKLRIVDLFSGCGGLTLGAFQAASGLRVGLEIAFAVDINKPALDVYKSNFSELSKRIEQGDIGQFVDCNGFLKLTRKGQNLIREIGEIGILLAGPPCQGNSNLNNSSRRSDPRNELYLAPVLFAEKLRPNLVIIENVPGVIHSDTNVVQRSVDRLEKMGYACSQFRTDLSALGLPQTRKRHLLVASLLHSASELESLLAVIPKTAKLVPLWDFISDLEDSPNTATDAFNSTTRMSEANVQRINYLFDEGLFDLPNALRPPCHSEKPHSYVSMYGRLRLDAPSQTVTSGFGSMGQGRFVHPTRRRMITPHEAARIQGFPDYFEFGDSVGVTELRQMIGNAVAPALSQVVIQTLMK